MPLDAPNRCPNCFGDTVGEHPCARCGLSPDEPRPANAPPLGTVLNGPHEIGRVLGRPGGFGITYLAFDRQLETTVAIKEYLPRDVATQATDAPTILAQSNEDGELFRCGLAQLLIEARTRLGTGARCHRRSG
jgi:serine/threonine protein kinase